MKFRLPILNNEIVNRIISSLSIGNSDLELVMRASYLAGKDIVDKWSDNETERLAKKLVLISGYLIHRRINPDAFREDPKGYWETERGQVVGRALSEFVGRKGLRLGG